MGVDEGFSKGKQRQSSPGSSDGKFTLRRTIELIYSLISFSHSIKVFSGKWQLIRNKLEELNSGLVAAENCDSGDIPPISDLIPAIMTTIDDCRDLARRCVDLSYSGKLLMQSDLDVLSAKFDHHIKKLSGIYTAGILTQSSAIVVSRPCFGATREDVKFFVKDLLTRMKIGDSYMKMQALVSLNEVMAEDEKYTKILVGIEESINLLINYLDSPETEIQEQAVKALSVIVGFDSCKGVLISSGIIAPLVRILESGSQMGKERAARILQKLTQNSDNSWSVSAHGGVTALLRICSNGGAGGDLMGLACDVLRNLAGVDEIKKFMVEEGCVSTFIKLSRSKDEALQINSIDILQAMASGNESILQLIIKEGGIRALVKILDPKSEFSFKTRETALRAIESLCFRSTANIHILMAYGFLDHLLLLLRKGENSIQELALKVSVRLCSVSEETKKTMGDTGFMPEIVRMLTAKSSEVQEMAAQALSGMVLVSKNRKKFVQEDRNVELLLQLLQPEERNSGNTKFLLSTLSSLSSSNGGRKKILNSRYLKNLEKLAEADVTEAKKIVRKLSTNTFLSIFSGLWYPSSNSLLLYM
ncbi:vacuolar protein 8 [Malania oleifera]|uniref:vacuolar protein 8 n=1 Tax=Malania oleifera TaxID=397392 RepID=UPI0025AE8EF6|nr:vacuolar protein 8 [Malania oleifera]